ncbi:MAG: four helix bundle protein [Actinobacteria bacterium]|nr:four helix bundle protein [Actinomycetota bacterium]
MNEQSHIAIVPEEPRGWPEIEYATQKAVARLGNLATHVDQLASKFPLNSSPGLRSQMRRAALDALTNVACGLEATSAHDYRQLMLRSRCALSELDTFARLGGKSSVITPTEVSHLALLVQQADHAVRLGLQECQPLLRGAA